MGLNIFKWLFDRREGREDLVPLYRAIILRAREPVWFREGQVPDTFDGRFDVLALILALVLVRLEALGGAAIKPGVLLTEVFVDDMEGQLRQDGVGDVVIGKNVGKMMSALGGRISALREALQDREKLEPALVRNLYRGAAPSVGAVQHVRVHVEALIDTITQTSLNDLMQGNLGQ